MRRRTETNNPAAYYQPQQIITMADVDRYRTAAREYWRLSRSRLMTVWMLGALLVALLAAAVTMVVTGRVKLDSVVRNEPKVDVFELKNIGELATQAGYFTTVQTVKLTREADLKVVKFTVPLSEATYVFSYDGVVRAGLNFSDIDLNIDDEHKTITVKLPETKILSTTLDKKSFQQYTGGGNLMSQLTPNEISEGRDLVCQKAEKTAIENGILGEARENAKVLIKEFLAGGYDLDEYNVVFQ